MNIDNEILFWKVFRNLFIRFSISKQLEIFEKNEIIIYNSNDEIRNDRFIDYRSKIIINFKDQLEQGILLSSSAKTVLFSDGYNEVIPERTLPEQSIETIIFGRDYNKVIGVNVLPFGLQNLILGSSFNQELIEDSIPSSITNLEFSREYDKPLYVLHPNSVKRLDLGYKFNQDLYSGYIPNSVEDLKISMCFNKQLKSSYTFKGEFKEGSIPQSVKKLDLGGHYNHELLPGLIPSSVTYLKLSFNFNQILKPLSIPSSVTSLILTSYNQTFQQNVLPNSIKKLNLGYKYNRQLNNLPKYLESLTLGEHYNQPIIYLPSTLKKLKFINSKFNQPISSSNIPRYLESLKFSGGSYFNNAGQPFAEDTLPSTLHTLKLCFSFNQDIIPNSIPKSCKVLRLSNITTFNQDLLPPSLTRLSLISDITYSKNDNCSPIPVGIIPQSVKIIKFKSGYNQPILPGAITSAHTIYFGESFNQKLENGSIPSTCKALTFSSYFGNPFLPGVLPDSIEQLSLMNLRDLVPGSIPNSVIKLSIKGSFYQFSSEPQIIPPSIKYLELNNRLSDLSLEEDDLHIPNTIKYLKLSQDYTNSFYKSNPRLPKSLKYLYIKSNNNIIKIINK